MTPESSLLFEFAEHEPGITPANAASIRKWRILVVDDEPNVHESTRFSLQHVQILGCPLELLFASSAQEARAILMKEKDLALVLLDVVMESESAGLELVDFIRNKANLKTTRIVLRTGQPGYAPEYESIVNYDINDYKSKAELTHVQLLTTVTAAIRSYKQLKELDESRIGLELVLRATEVLMTASGLETFATGVIIQLAALLGTRAEGLVCAKCDRGSRQYVVLAAAGHFASSINQPLDTLDDECARRLLSSALAEKGNVITPQGIALYFGEKHGLEMAAYVEKSTLPNEPDRHLLDIFCTNLCACLRNLGLVDRLHTQAYYDPLVKLPNRARFIVSIDEVLTDPTAQASLALVDIDDFSSINDLMGHGYADSLLQAYSQRLRQVLGPDVTIARVASNTFGLLGRHDQVNPTIVQSTVTEALSLGHASHRISVTSGYAELRPAVQGGDNWIKDVNVALKHAKRNNRASHAYFTTVLGQESRSRAQLLANLQKAFSETRLFLMYQPQVDLLTRRVVGLEALARWRTEDGQLVPPDQFIPVAEQSGLILPLGEWVLQTACGAMKQLELQGLAPARMAVNLSVVQFQHPDMLAQLDRILSSSGLSGTQLDLEITESVAMIGTDDFESTLTALRTKGISVSIDDFGTGYSSLSYLDRLPIDRLKIDRSFVEQISNAQGPRIAEMIIQLGNKLGVKVLAEGLEDEATLLSLQAMGCHEVQGYHIAKPMVYEDLVAWLRQAPM